MAVHFFVRIEITCSSRDAVFLVIDFDTFGDPQINAEHCLDICFTDNSARLGQLPRIVCFAIRGNGVVCRAGLLVSVGVENPFIP